MVLNFNTNISGKLWNRKGFYLVQKILRSCAIIPISYISKGGDKDQLKFFSSRNCITKEDESHNRNQITIFKRCRAQHDLSCIYFWRWINSNLLHNNKIQFSIARVLTRNVLTRNFFVDDLLNSRLRRKGFKDSDQISRELLIERVFVV